MRSLLRAEVLLVEVAATTCAAQVLIARRPASVARAVGVGMLAAALTEAVRSAAGPVDDAPPTRLAVASAAAAGEDHDPAGGEGSWTPCTAVRAIVLSPVVLLALAVRVVATYRVPAVVVLWFCLAHRSARVRAAGSAMLVGVATGTVNEVLVVGAARRRSLGPDGP